MPTQNNNKRTYQEQNTVNNKITNKLLPTHTSESIYQQTMLIII